MIESDKPAILIRNCSVLGRSKTNVRKFKVCDANPYAQYDRTVTIIFSEPKKRTAKCVRVNPDNLTFYTIEQNGEIVYDSRNDVPLDADAFRQSYEKNKAQWERDREEEAKWAAHPGWSSVMMSNYSEEIVL